MFTDRTACTTARTSRGRSHTFDPLSGWCRWGCGNRDDGRIVNKGGTVIEEGPRYDADDLAAHKHRVDTILAARKAIRA